MEPVGRRSAARAAAVVAAVLLVASGCGETSAPRLSADRAYRLATAQALIANYCLARINGVDTAREYRSYLDSLDRLIAIYRPDPDAVYQPRHQDPQLTMRQVLSDQASDLEEGCGEEGHEGAARLDRALRDG